MRARMVVGSALGLLLGVACSAVPDLRFGDAEDGGGPIVDSSAPQADGAVPSEDGAAPHDASVFDAGDGSPTSEDGAASVCPGSPPKNSVCCGAIDCRPGGGGACDCNGCEQHCAAQGVCCMNRSGVYQACATTLGGCPPP